MPAPAVNVDLSPYRYSQPGSVPHLTSNQAATWATSSGTLLLSASPRIVYAGSLVDNVYLEPLNESRTITVSATNLAAETGTRLVKVYMTLLPVPDRGTEAEDEEPAVKTYAPDKKTFKVKYLGEAVEKYNLKWIARRAVEKEQIKALKAFHRLHIPFYLDERVLGDLKIVCFDSGIRKTGGAVNLIDFDCVVREYYTQIP